MLREIQKVMVAVRSGSYLLAITLFAAGLAPAQQQPAAKDSAGAPARQAATSGKKNEQKPALVDAARVSTDAAARGVAQDQAKKPEAENSKSSPGDAVMELRAVEPGSAPGQPIVSRTKSSKGPLKDVHGTVYGSTDPGNTSTHAVGGAAGASSKSGKTSVYVETDRARDTVPH